MLFSGVQCETAKADLVMLVDESGSISSVDFRVMKSFLIEIVKNFNIGPDKVQIGKILLLFILLVILVLTEFLIV